MHRNIEVYKAHLNRIHFPFPLPPLHQPGGWDSFAYTGPRV